MVLYIITILRQSGNTSYAVAHNSAQEALELFTTKISVSDDTDLKVDNTGVEVIVDEPKLLGNPPKRFIRERLIVLKYIVKTIDE